MDNFYTKILQKIGIVPSNELFNAHPKLYRCLSLVHGILVILICVIPLIIIIPDYCLIIGGFQCSFMIAEFVIFAIIMISSVFIKNVFYPSSYIAIRNNFKEIDIILQKHDIEIEPEQTIIGCILLQVCFASSAVFSISMYTAIFPIIYLVCGIWTYYQILVQFYFAWKVLEQLHLRLKHVNGLNKSLLETSFGLSCGTQYSYSSEAILKSEVTIYQLILIQNKIIQIVQHFNQLFGFTILMLSLGFMIEVLDIVSSIFLTIPDNFFVDLLDTFIHLVI